MQSQSQMPYGQSPQQPTSQAPFNQQPSAFPGQQYVPPQQQQQQQQQPYTSHSPYSSASTTFSQSFSQPYSQQQQQPHQPPYNNQYPYSQHAHSHGYVPFTQTTPTDPMTLLLEQRHATTHVVRRVDEIADRIEGMNKRLDSDSISMVSRRSRPDASVLEDSLGGQSLIVNIQRMVDDYERVKTELAAKSERVDSLQAKVTELLEKNERYVICRTLDIY